MSSSLQQSSDCTEASFLSFNSLTSFDSEAPLCEAAWKGDFLSVSHLADPQCVNQISSSGFSSLQYAAARGDLEVVRILTEAGAQVDQEDKDGWTSLMWAVWGVHPPVVSYLLQKGAKIDQPNSIGETTIHLACQSSDKKTEKYEVLKMLILGGGGINQQTVDGETCLHMAVTSGDSDLVSIVIDYGGWINAQDYNGETPLHWAVREGYRSIIQKLIDGGADVNVQNDDMETPLHLACGCDGSWDMVQMLFQANVMLDVQDESGTTPLMEAVLSGQFVVAKMLLRRGADPNKIDSSGRTALHFAVEGECSGELLNDLLVAGADLSILDEDGKRPTDYIKTQRTFQVLTRCYHRLVAEKQAQNHLIIQGERSIQSPHLQYFSGAVGTSHDGSPTLLNFSNSPIS